MSLLDINHNGMQDMDLYEKRKIITSAMIKAKVFTNKRISLLIIFMCILTLVVGASLWFSTGLLTGALLGFFVTPLFGLLIVNKAAKSLYLPFLKEAVSEQDLILGDTEQRNKIKKQRNWMFIIYIAFFVLYNFYITYLTAT